MAQSVVYADLKFAMAPLLPNPICPTALDEDNSPYENVPLGPVPMEPSPDWQVTRSLQDTSREHEATSRRRCVVPCTGSKGDTKIIMINLRGCMIIRIKSDDTSVGSILGLILFEAFTCALDDGMGMDSASWRAIPNWAVVGILEGKTGVQRHLEESLMGAC
ncbi:b-cell differentiation antigen cd72-like [Limosa lapponica baueri]|uniref:B-cell differentiation antigen cd72-like n=1 Tax=Limosa lapponica baueri TaxID=1758121 RepID=A0A2I0TXR4_LIMLA|nr:b-cell differentiation antigen cd72-like [Limosa lapponica baueri]